MKVHLSELHDSLVRLHAKISRVNMPDDFAPILSRVQSDLSAAIFHLSRTNGDKPFIAIIGGTGTGKSTLVNRLLGTELTATSFRRTYTAGPIAIMSDHADDNLPPGFGSLIHVDAQETPARGKPDRITIVRTGQPLVERLTLIDTPDIDGEITEHHAAADRIFRWADGVIFLVSPEKYQMPELQPYYRLAMRYGIASVFMMNKADEPAVVDDYAKLLTQSGLADVRVRALPRDDSTWQPPGDVVLTSACLESMQIQPSDSALNNRCRDVINRFEDTLLAPLREKRTRIDGVVRAIKAFHEDSVSVDVHPMSQQLQRRLREKSILYLVGPQRMLDRVRSVPSMLARLPKTMWGWTKTGEFQFPDVAPGASAEVPDFRAIVVEQFQSLQARLHDLIRDQGRIESVEWKKPVEEAGEIVNDEVAKLRQWLEVKWNATPRDTAILNKLFKLIPGGSHLNKLSEAAPYLMTGYLAMSGALFGHLDLILLGSYGTAVTLFQKLSDEVASRTRETNRAIRTRYETLVREQITHAISWLDRQTPRQDQLAEVDRILQPIRTAVLTDY